MIRQLEIQNFRCFKSAHLSNVRRLNLITGRNGAGKTALLESLFITGGNTAEIYLRTSAWRGREDIQLPFSNSGIGQLFEDFFYQFDTSTGFRIVFHDNESGDREVRVAVTNQEVLAFPVEGKEPSESLTMSNVGNSPPLKFFWKTPAGEFQTALEWGDKGWRVSRPTDAYFMVFLSTATVGSPSEIAQRYSDLSARNKEAPILKAVRRIFPQIENLMVLATGGTSAIHASVRGVSRKIPLGLLSAGINKFVAVLAAICTAPRGAVLIDEVENGWYYQSYQEMWRAITELALENHTQLFTTTHSREFLEAVAPLALENSKDYSLIRAEKLNGEATLTEFSGRELAGAISSGFDVR